MNIFLESFPGETRTAPGGPGGPGFGNLAIWQFAEPGSKEGGGGTMKGSGGRYILVPNERYEFHGVSCLA